VLLPDSVCLSPGDTFEVDSVPGSPLAGAATGESDRLWFNSAFGARPSPSTPGTEPCQQSCPARRQTGLGRCSARTSCCNGVARWTLSVLDRLHHRQIFDTLRKAGFDMVGGGGGDPYPKRPPRKFTVKNNLPLPMIFDCC
jgi:hypothetical protein